MKHPVFPDNQEFLPFSFFFLIAACAVKKQKEDKKECR